MKFLVKMRAILILFLLLGGVVFGQKLTVHDLDTKQAIPNVAIFNDDKTKIVLTDFDGQFNGSSFLAKERITFQHLSYEIKKTTKEQIEKQGGKVFLVLKPEELDEVIMSVSKWEQQKKDIPNKIASIGAREIEFTSPQTSADLLQNSGKVFVQKSQLGGGSPMIRGFATNRLVLSVDGVRMNNAIFRGGNLQNVISIDPFTIKNTEVVFGPGSVIYGSDAIGGVMNFFTKSPAFSTTDSLVAQGNLNYRFASTNLENTIHADITVGKRKWSSLTSVTYNNFNDLTMGSHGPDSYLRKIVAIQRNGKDELIANENPKKQIPTAYDQLNLMQKIRFRPSTDWDFNLGLFYSETSDYDRYDRLIRPNNNNDGLRSAAWFYGPQKWFMGNVRALKKGNGHFYDGVKLTTAYQHFEESRNNRDFDSNLLNQTKEKVDALNINIDFENKNIGNYRFYYGGEFIFNKVYSQGSTVDISNSLIENAPSRYPNGSTWKSLAGYVNAEQKAKPNFTLMYGLRYSHVWIHALFDQTFYQFPFNNANLNTGALTGSMGFSWFPKEDMQITANGSTGFRAPNIDDVGKVFDSEPGSVVVPNPNLESEYAYNLDVGIQKNIKDIVVVKAATYYTYLVDALVRRDYTYDGMSQILYQGELSQVQAIQNAAKAYVYGFEFGADAFLTEHWSVSSNLTVTKGIEEDDTGFQSAARHAAPTFGDFHIIWKNEKFKADAFINYNGEIPYESLALTERAKTYIYAMDNNGNPYSPSWYSLNLRTRYQLFNNCKLHFNLENITDQRYRTYSSGIVAPGINAIIGLGYRF